MAKQAAPPKSYTASIQYLTQLSVAIPQDKRISQPRKESVIGKIRELRNELEEINTQVLPAN
jgi:hypothetical protein